MTRDYFLQHSPIDFNFTQSPRDFVVEEIPLYEFTGEGEHLAIKIRKKNLTTWEMLQAISEHVGVKVRDIGYAGLKDKNALTVQYISIHRNFKEKLEKFEHESIKILEMTHHKNKIKLGHLKGNKFFIRLKRVTPVDAKKVDQALKTIKKYGMPNFFGYQRFGNYGDNYLQGEKIANGELKIRDQKKKRFLLNAYQSFLYNNWLSKRLQISRIVESFSVVEAALALNMDEQTVASLKAQEHPFKILNGDVCNHYPVGRVFVSENENDDAKRFLERDISITGLLSGRKVKNAEKDALEVENEYVKDVPCDGDRRYAWIWPEEIEGEYKSEENWFELHFYLPKGCYATVLLEELAHKSLKEN